MGIWYSILALANLLVGGFMCVSVYGFTPETSTDIGFALSIAVACLGLAMGYVGLQSSKTNERIGLGVLGYATAALAAWTIVATQAFDPETAQWMVFGSGCGHIALSVTGIITHEATQSRRPRTRAR
jgi:hypothetical protein